MLLVDYAPLVMDCVGIVLVMIGVVLWGDMQPPSAPGI